MVSYEEKDIEIDGIHVRLFVRDVRRLCIKVNRQGKAEMIMPLGFSETEARKFLAEKADWLRRSLASVNERLKHEQRLNTHTFENGDTFTIWGKEYHLRLVEDAPRVEAYTDGDYLILTSPRPLTTAKRKQALSSWIFSQLRSAVKEDLDFWLERLDEKPLSEVRFKNMRSRWGSCLPLQRIVCFNVRLVFYPRPCTRAIVLHELCHLKEANHGPRFHALMLHYMPDHKRWTDCLKH